MLRLPDDLMEVAKEERRPWTWFFSPNLKTFFRLDEDGKPQGSIKGAFLPNPELLKEGRIRTIEAGRLPKDARVEADPITYKLWNYWNAFSNN